MKTGVSKLTDLDAMKDHPESEKLNSVFKTVIKSEVKAKSEGAPMADSSVKDQELSLLDEEIEISLTDEEPPQNTPQDSGMELSLDGEETIDLSSDAPSAPPASEELYGDLSLEGEDLGFSLNDDGTQDKSTTNIVEPASMPDIPEDEGLTLGDEDLNLVDEPLNLAATSTRVLTLDEKMDLESNDSTSNTTIGQIDSEEGLSLDFSDDEELVAKETTQSDFSDDAKKKLKEIDAILVEDASRIHIRQDLGPSKNPDEPLVSADLDLGSLNFGAEEVQEPTPPKEEKAKKKKKEAVEARDLGSDLKEISGAYSGEMERMQATISNLRSDRNELLNKIQRLEEDRVGQSRNSLSMRAELDEKKIELTIIRKKLNEEITDLKDKMKLYDERKLIWEEKIRFLQQELDKSSQKSKIDVRKVQMRERELEQRLELLKSDAETQIRNRDLKILELKRKIDAMEFDMESISHQEKKSIESRFELEDKLDKAIKTLRSAISVLENESDRSNALDALKKNLDV